MKKIFLSTVTIITFFSANAQMNLRYGPQVGFGISTLNLAVSNGTSQNATAVSGKSGIQIGGVLDMGFGDHFSVQPALLYYPKGASGAKINYLEIPVNLVYTKGERHGFFVMAGPYLAMAMSGTGVNIGKTSDSTGTNYGIKKTDFGVAAGLGYQLAMGLSFSFHYDIGISDISYDKNVGYKITNGAYMFCVTWLFGGEPAY